MFLAETKSRDNRPGFDKSPIRALFGRRSRTAGRKEGREFHFGLRCVGRIAALPAAFLRATSAAAPVAIAAALWDRRSAPRAVIAALFLIAGAIAWVRALSSY